MYMLKYLLISIFLVSSIPGSFAQDHEWKYRYTISDFDKDGYTDTLYLKSYKPGGYEWNVNAVNGKTGEIYCLLGTSDPFCRRFLYYIPIPEPFQNNEQFMDSLLLYTFPRAVQVDIFTPEMDWIFRMKKATTVLRDTSVHPYGFKYYSDPGIKWVNEPVRPPVHTLTIVEKDSDYYPYRLCQCGEEYPPVFDHTKGLLVYSAIHHRFLRDWDDPDKTWQQCDIRNDTMILASKHGVIIATDSSYAWLFHMSFPLSPLGYKGMRRKTIKMVHRVGDILFVQVGPGLTDPDRLYVVDISTGKVSGMDVCTLVKCYNIDACFVKMNVIDGNLIIYDAEVESETYKDVRIPLDEVIGIIEKR